jgi:hypothetical protein
MTKKTWQIEGMEVGGQILAQGGTAELGFVHRRLSGGLRSGVELIEVTCGDLQFSVIPTRGMGIWKATCQGVEFGWRSPVAGPVHPSFVPVHDPSGLGWLDGFDELLARCGLLSNGAPEFDALGRVLHPLHGRIANTPAHRVEIRIDEPAQSLEIRGTVLESRFHFQKLQLTTVYRCKVGEATIGLIDEVTNCSGGPATFQSLYHFNFGPPLLDSGAKIIAPAREIAPRDIAAANAIDGWDTCTDPIPQFKEQVFFMKLFEDQRHHASVMMHNSQSDTGAVLSYEADKLPCFTLWKNTTSPNDGYVIGLEPGTNFPNVRSFEEKRGRVVSLGAGESYKIRISLAFCVGREKVAKAIASVRALQSSPPHQLLMPSPEYSPLVEPSEPSA